MKEKKGFVVWVKKHKKELIIAGVSIATIIGIIVAINNKNKILDLCESLKKCVENSRAKVPTVSSKVVESIAHQNVHIAEVVSATETIKFSSNHMMQGPFDVSDHLRNLPDGWHASAEKITRAAEYGYNLKSGQTWVDAYTKGGVAA